MANILIIEDDPEIRKVLRIALTGAGHTPREAGDGPEGLAKALSGDDDLILLDIGLPGMGGLTLCRQLREKRQTPVLFLTARDDEVDRVLGLELGGDDYVTKPFSTRELLARIKAILRRGAGRPDGGADILTLGAITIDPTRHLCQVNGNDVSLTRREMGILHHLMQHPEQVSSKVSLSDAVYGPTIHVSDRTFDSHLRNLRAKLSRAGAPDAIETLHGVGIRMAREGGQ